MTLTISYAINPFSGPVIVQQVLDIRPATYNKAGDIRSGYSLPDELRVRRFVRQMGLVTKGDKAYVCMQPPAGIYIPDFGRGPITGRAVVRAEEVELRGNYDKFPDLPRTKTIYVREIVDDEKRAIRMITFDMLNSFAMFRPLTEGAIQELMHDPAFRAALEEVFGSTEFRTDFAAPERLRVNVQEPAPASTRIARDYSRPQNGYPLETVRA